MCWIQEFALYLLVKKSLPRFDFSSMKKQLRVLSDWKSLITLRISSDEDTWPFTFFSFRSFKLLKQGNGVPYNLLQALGPT